MKIVLEKQSQLFSIYGDLPDSGSLKLYVFSGKHTLKAIDRKKIENPEKLEKYLQSLVLVAGTANEFCLITAPKIAEKLRTSEGIAEKIGSRGSKISIEEISEEEYEVLKDCCLEEMDEKEKKPKSEKEEHVHPSTKKKVATKPLPVLASLKKEFVLNDLLELVAKHQAKTLRMILDRFQKQIQEQKKRAAEKKEKHQKEQELIKHETLEKERLASQITEELIKKSRGV